MGSTRSTIDFSKIKIGGKVLENAVLDIGTLNPERRPYITKGAIIKALADKDLPTLRLISDYFYQTSGIYYRVCNYFAELYRYDWYVVASVLDDSEKTINKIVSEFNKTLNYLDGSYIKKMCGDIALNVVKNGCYYGYVVNTPTGITIQDLPHNYCRSRYKINGMPAVEFNLAFFDDKFSDTGLKLRVLKLFPEEFYKAYLLYKQNKLPKDTASDTAGWFLLDPAFAVKFNLNSSDVPIFISALPAILDLDAAQDLDRRKQMQKLLKILIQKLPMDKNGDLIFDIDEARDIHNNAVEMLRRAVGVDILTTFADIDAIDLSDKNTTATQDDLQKVERTVYNAFGISRNIFNTDGNMALEKSILDDESTMRNLLLQFAIFFDKIVEKRNINRKKFSFKFYMLETTQYNYKELSKLYKEQTQIGFSKMLPQIALGHSQSAILNTAYFENEILHLSQIMIPPLMSSTLSGSDILGNDSSNNSTKSQNTTESNAGGRPAKDNDQLSEKTIANKESMS